MKQVLIVLLSIVVLARCGSSHKDNNIPIPPLGKASLLAPAQNEVCTQGTVISATQSTVTLKWAVVTNAISYQVNIKNLEDGTTTTQTTTNTQFSITLTRNAPYSWSITAIAANTTTSLSDNWKFYNSGPSIVSYAPFPAEIVTPAMNQNVTVSNGKVTLSWNGSDVDGDITNYDVYLGASPTPAVLQSNVLENTLKDVSVSAGKTYYWKVITRDSKGNTSDSGVYQFATK